MFRITHGRFISGPVCIITAEIVVGLHPPEPKTKVTIASVAREAAEA